MASKKLPKLPKLPQTSETYKDQFTPWMPECLVVLPSIVSVAELRQAQEALALKDRALASCMANDIFVALHVTARLERIRIDAYDDGD